MSSSELYTFAERTTLHGFPHIIKATTSRGKLFWTIVCVLSLGAFGYYSYRILHRFLLYEKNVGIQMVRQDILFPKLTLCNFNPISENVTRKLLLEQERVYHPNAELFIDKYANYRSEMDECYKKDLPVATCWSFGSRAGFAAYMGIEQMLEVGIPKDVFVLRCTYQNNECNYTIQTVFSSFFYKCISLSFYDLDGGPLIQQAGLNNAMALFLYIGPYHKNTTQIWPLGSRGLMDSHEPDGMKLVLHDNNTYPFPLNEGITISAKTHTSINYKSSFIKRIGKPYVNCLALENNYYQNYRYSESLCAALCIQKLLLEQCGCMDISYPLLREENASLCIPFKSNYSNQRTAVPACGNFTIENVIRNASKPEMRKDHCQCYPSCQETAYNTQASHTQWPRKEYHGSMFHTVYGTIINSKFLKYIYGIYDGWFIYAYSEEGERFVNAFTSNVAKVTISLSDMDSTEVTETAGYEEAQMIADLGGMLGLFVGLSVITCAEILQFFIRVAYHCCKKLTPEGFNKNKVAHVGQEYS